MVILRKLANLYVSLVIEHILLPFVNSIQVDVLLQDIARSHTTVAKQHALHNFEMLLNLLDHQIFLQSSTYGNPTSLRTNNIHCGT